MAERRAPRDDEGWYSERRAGACVQYRPAVGSNLTGTERFDQIFLLMRSRGAGAPRIAEYGVFDIPSLVKNALKGYRLKEKTRTDRIRQQISDHVPIWIRLKLPDPLKV